MINRSNSNDKIGDSNNEADGENRIAHIDDVKEIPRVAVIVLNWNKWQETIECLEYVKEITYPNYQIVVVDNGSTDGSANEIRNWFFGLGGEIVDTSPEVIALAYSYEPFDLIFSGFFPLSKRRSIPIILLETGYNRGYAGGNNVGLAWAIADGCEQAFILNNDAHVKNNIIDNIIQIALESNASVVGALIKDANGEHTYFVRSFYPIMLLFSDFGNRIPYGNWWLTDRVDGSGMLLARDLLIERRQSLGYFLDSSLFLYCEETELGLWCRRAGKKSVIAKNAVIYHKLSISSGGKGNPLQFYYITRNRMLIANQYLPNSLKVLFFLIYSFIRISRAGMYVILGKRDTSRAIILGLLDGYRGKRGQKEWST